MFPYLEILRPKVKEWPLIFDSPHSGRIYPPDFAYACDFAALQTAEDRFVDELIGPAVARGAHVLCAQFPRSYIDVNRAPNDIEPEILGPHPWTGPFELQPSARAHAGIGLIRRLVRPGVPLYNRALSTGEILRRLKTCYHPYHSALEELLGAAHYCFGQAWYISLHSMPAASAFPKRPLGLAGHKPVPADFVLGDRDGTSCAADFTRAVRQFLKNLGYNVSVNDPFKGVELLRKFSDPARGLHALQIEINMALYLNENTGEKLPGFTKLQDTLAQLTDFIARYIQAELVNKAAD
jgi:N-formylglutamate deformylase